MLNTKYPLVCVTPFGTISLMMAHNVNIELGIDRSIRIVCWDKFVISSNQKSTKSGILHPFGHILHEDDKVFCYFYPNNATLTNNGAVESSGTVAVENQVNLSKMAILGTQGVLFSMSHLKDAFLVSAAAVRGTSALSMDRIQFPSLRYDYTIRQFYMDTNIGEEHIYACNNIVKRAKYEEKEGMLFTLSINGFLIRQKENGDVEVFCRPRQIICSPAESLVHVRCANVEMEIQANDKAYVKCGAKRVHVSRSGMVVSDGNCTASMDHIGRIVSTS